MSHKKTTIEQVREFMTLGQQTINNTPTTVANELANFRVNLIMEEAKELFEALSEKNTVEVLDALCDLQYVLDGAFHTFGMANLKEEAMNAVHSSNMSKFCTSEEEAEETIKSYTEKGIQTYAHKVEVPENGNMKFYWIIYRSEDNKVLKSNRYEAVTERLKALLQVQ